MAKRRVTKYTPEQKDEVVQFLREGGGASIAARKFNVPVSTILTWAKALDGPVDTMVSVPGLPHFSVNGVISVMKVRYDEVMQLADSYDKAIHALQSLETVEEQMRKFEAELAEHRKALAFFLREGEK